MRAVGAGIVEKGMRLLGSNHSHHIVYAKIPDLTGAPRVIADLEAFYGSDGSRRHGSNDNLARATNNLNSGVEQAVLGHALRAHASVVDLTGLPAILTERGIQENFLYGTPKRIVT
jgi:hypothetical protein